MKKQVLSALAFCSALGIAQAQTDVTKEYLVNPSFETLKAADGTTDVAVKTKLESGLYGWDVAKLGLTIQIIKWKARKAVLPRVSLPTAQAKSNRQKAPIITLTVKVGATRTLN